ncbi:3-hydroxyacyl-CoA dehydrogenase family protein [Streptomyces roseus]|uniref:3-hydroxyacyl-CoA dehydrogenase family protein n=1 Tax=Streptomyces roseus TaxID=66430 RepID=UPI0038030B75
MAVVGLGTVGEALIHLLCSSGHDTVGIDSDRGALERIRGRLTESATASVGRGEVTLTASMEKQELQTADLVFVTSSEEPEEARAVLRQLDAVCQPTTVFATAFQAFSLFNSALASGRPTQTLGLRFLMPPAMGISVETLSAPFTSALAVAVLEKVLQNIGLQIAPIGAGPGSNATALVFAYLNRAVEMLDSGYATRDDIDKAMRLGCGFRYGPLELLDCIGLDVVCAQIDAPSPLLVRMVQTGMLGRKAGRGFYEYDAPVLSVTGRQGRSEVQPPLRSVGVIGSGVMAKGIAQVAALAGFETTLVARSGEKATTTMDAIEGAIRSSVRRGVLSVSDKEAALARLSGTHDVTRVRSCDVVIEAVAEDPRIKPSVFEVLGSVCRPGTILATTTSSLSVSDCATASRRPEDVVGLHFFNPAPKMRLVELVRTPYASQKTLSLSRSFCLALDKSVVECDDRSGFIVNWLLFPYLAAAARLLDRADVDIAAVDAAIIRGFGHPLGPFSTLDIIGLDVSESIMMRLQNSFPGSDFEVPSVVSQMVSRGLLGRKTELGFFPTPVRRPIVH